MLDCSCCFDAWVSSMLVVTACDCSTLDELTISTYCGGSFWSCQDQSTWRFGPLDLTIQGVRSIFQHERYLYLNSILIKTTCPRIHPMGSESWSSRGSGVSLIWSFLQMHILNGSEALSNGDFPLESSWLTSLEHFHLFRQIFEFVGDHAVDLSLLEHSSQLLVPACRPLSGSNFI